MQNLTISDLNSSSVAARTSIITKRRDNDVGTSGSRSRQNPRKSTNVPLYNSKSYIRRTHPDDPAENSILADLSYIPEPLSVSAGPTVASKGSIFHLPVWRQFALTRLQSGHGQTRSYRTWYKGFKPKFEILRKRMQIATKSLRTSRSRCNRLEVMVRSNESMVRALDSSCFVVLPCRHYVMVDKKISTLTNSKCPKCNIHVTESYLVKHKWLLFWSAARYWHRIYFLQVNTRFEG